MHTTTMWFARARRLEMSRGSLLLLAAWVLSMVSLPILYAFLGDRALLAGVLLTALLQAGAVLAILGAAWGFARVLRVALVVVAAAWAVEFVGSRSGIPFGAYQYTDRLQPQLGGVPLVIPLAWLMMLPPAWAVGAAIARRSRGPAFVLASALAFTAWDLFLDPQMVGWGFWTWHDPAGYFGIPWVNFAGWLVASALITWLARPSALPIMPLLLVYGITWALETIGQFFFWDLRGPALAGGVAMGALLAWALRSGRERAA